MALCSHYLLHVLCNSCSAVLILGWSTLPLGLLHKMERNQSEKLEESNPCRTPGLSSLVLPLSYNKRKTIHLLTILYMYYIGGTEFLVAHLAAKIFLTSFSGCMVLRMWLRDMYILLSFLIPFYVGLVCL